MVKTSRGFTLIEVSLFLVITGALFISIAVGVQNSIYQQRANDSVQSFVEFLRTVYSEVSNVQIVENDGGRSEKAIYGRLITFGETTNIEGQSIESPDTKNIIYAYDIIGNIGDVGTNNVLESLKELRANIVILENNILKPAGLIEAYTPKWTAQIEPPCNEEADCRFIPFRGAVLIVRHPGSGTTYTYVMKDNTIQANEYIKKLEDAYEIAKANEAQATTDEQRAEAQSIINSIASGSYNNILGEYLNSNYFKISDIDFCINPYGGEVNNNRYDVRIKAGARNSSGVEVISDDNSNRCREQKD